MAAGTDDHLGARLQQVEARAHDEAMTFIQARCATLLPSPLAGKPFLLGAANMTVCLP